MRLGANTKCFGGMKTEEVAKLFERSGLTCAELCFCHEDLDGWRYNFCKDVQLPPLEDVRRSVKIFSDYGIEVTSIGVYCRFFGGGNEGLSETVSQFSSFMDIASECGIGTVCTHGGIIPVQGTRISSMLPEYKKQATEGFCDVCVEAKKMGMTIGFEGSIYDIFKGYDGYLEMSESVCNYIGDSSMLQYIGQSYDVSNSEKIDKNTVMYHLKDISSDGKYYDRIGNGTCDLQSFFNKHKKCEKPMILEFVNSTNLLQTAGEVRKIAAAVK